jgi:hypothetical protein
MKKNTVTVTVTGEIRCHHMPQHSRVPAVSGLPLRQALTALRGTDWGSMGGMHDLELSDGTWLEVCCQGCSDGSSLMSSQVIQRMCWEDSDAKCLRTYRM